MKASTFTSLAGIAWMLFALFFPVIQPGPPEVLRVAATMGLVVGLFCGFASLIFAVKGD